MADVSLAILGMNRVGVSVGLALRRYNQQGGDHQFTVTGYDTNNASLKTAQKMNAIGTGANRLEQAARDKDIVVITMPYNEIKDVYEIIAPNLRAGAVVIDMTFVKQQSLNWAGEYLKEGTHLVCAEPIANPKYLFDGTDELLRASEDYFDKGSILLMPSTSCIKEAVTLATDFAALLGGEPTFFDPAEYDALMAATKALPALLGVTYYHTISQRPGWDDAQRLTGGDFGMLTRHLFDTHPDDLTALWLDSRTDLLHNLDSLLANLNQMRDALDQQDRDTLEAVLEHASRDYETWINRRYNNRWKMDEQMRSETPSFGGMMGNLMGGFMSGQNKDNNDK